MDGELLGTEDAIKSIKISAEFCRAAHYFLILSSVNNSNQIIKVHLFC